MCQNSPRVLFLDKHAKSLRKFFTAQAFLVTGLLFDNRAYGANGFARAAIDTFVLANYEFHVALADSVNGARIYTTAASDTFVRYCSRHILKLLTS